MARPTCTASWRPTSICPWAAHRPSWLSRPPPAATRCLLPGHAWMAHAALACSMFLTFHACQSQVIEVHVNLMTCNITDGLTEDAVSARLHQGVAPALFSSGLRNPKTPCIILCAHPLQEALRRRCISTPPSQAASRGACARAARSRSGSSASSASSARRCMCPSCMPARCCGVHSVPCTVALPLRVNCPLCIAAGGRGAAVSRGGCGGGAAGAGAARAQPGARRGLHPHLAQARRAVRGHPPHLPQTDHRGPCSGTDENVFRRGRPKPVYHSTASQLGLHKTRGIPSLLDYVLPRNAPQVPRFPLLYAQLSLPPLTLGLPSNIKTAFLPPGAPAVAPPAAAHAAASSRECGLARGVCIPVRSAALQR